MFLMRFRRRPARNRGNDDAPPLRQSNDEAGGSDQRPANLQDEFGRDSLSCDYMRTLYDYWCETRGSEPIPPLKTLDPTLLPRNCLPYLSIVEVEQSPLRLRSRLSGTAVVEQLGVDQTGLYLDEIPRFAKQIERMEWCVRHGRPYLAEDAITFAPKDYKRYQVLILPFGDAGCGVQRIVGAFCFPDRSRPSY